MASKPAPISPSTTASVSAARDPAQNGDKASVAVAFYSCMC
jgi:hypothetical protein